LVTSSIVDLLVAEAPYPAPYQIRPER
jgi:hypothetical protein